MTCISISLHDVSSCCQRFARHFSRHLPNDGVECHGSFELEHVTAIFERKRLRPGRRGEEPLCMIPMRCDLVESAGEDCNRAPDCGDDVSRVDGKYSRDEGSEHAPQVPAVEQTNIRHFQPPCVHLISNRIKRQPCLAIELHRFFQIAHSSDRQVSRDLPKPSAFLTSAPSCCPSGRSRFAEALFRCRASVANSEPSPLICDEDPLRSYEQCCRRAEGLRAS